MSDRSSNISIRAAGVTDVESVHSVLVEAARWLEEKGDPLWRDDEISYAAVRTDVERGLYYLAEIDGKAVGTVRFQLTDEETWPDVADGDSAFVHRLAVRRNHSGGEVSTALLRWSVEHTAAVGRRCLRLDCEIRPKLQALYERFGFRWHSNRQVGPYLVARYELEVARWTREY